ncbi:unnamed protein product [Parnassius apollo]|uniref:(apollo) hypothetical protein n=1 Tax=Parnassius apollo TaxID=110799 RepID=A0A8S3WLX0_PARAO|nr:unnamed protein product [Parnassius apollo]
MWTKRLKLWRFMLCILFVVSALALAVRADDDDVPLESQCRPYIEKALKELESGDTEPDSSNKNDSSEVSVGDDTKEESSIEDTRQSGEENSNDGDDSKEDIPTLEVADEPYLSQAFEKDEEGPENNDSKEDVTTEGDDKDSVEGVADNSIEENGDSKEEASADEQNVEIESGENVEEAIEDENDGENSEENKVDDSAEVSESENKDADQDEGITSSEELNTEALSKEINGEDQAIMDSNEDNQDENNETVETKEENKTDDDDGSQEKAESEEKDEEDNTANESQELINEEEAKKQIDEEMEGKSETQSEEDKETSEENKDSLEDAAEGGVDDEDSTAKEVGDNGIKSAETGEDKTENKEISEADASSDTSSETDDGISPGSVAENLTETDEASPQESTESEEDGMPEEELLMTGEIPENLRSRDHIIQILRLDEEASEAELIIEKSADIVLRDLKRLYENSIKPLEVLYKYRDLSNRHFGDPEIFSKPLVLFMGPWSGGKSSILNYLTGLEFTEWSLRTGAEPSPAYFNILMHGKDPEVLDGTQLAADWTFSGLQKFGQGLEERLRGLKYPSKLLEKVNIVEIPGILEVRKQVSRVFPFNDACQWFIDRADIIFLVYDPSKLDVGPETEAILDQLKGRESQTRIVLNKADTVKPEELMRVQSALIWNISPLMSSAQPPVMYTVSLWSMPFEAGAPARLLQAQERELLRDLRQAIDRRIENKIASARRFAVRVRNHAKMVDCYLTTYYNHKTIFGNKKLIADAIIENPQNYHIYEGLSTLTNISRYDLPDPETYRDFFRLNPLYEFQQLSATCTYFRGCPITRLDVAIAYDLPELVGKYKKMVETAAPQGMPKS